MDSSLNQGPFQGPFDKDAVLFWDPKWDPSFRELPMRGVEAIRIFSCLCGSVWIGLRACR